MEVVDFRSYEGVGEVVTDLGSIVGSVGRRLTRPIGKGRTGKGKAAKRGTLTISASEVSSSNKTATFSCSARSLDKKDFLGKSDPYLELYKVEHGTELLLYRTEYIKKNLNPTW